MPNPASVNDIRQAFKDTAIAFLDQLAAIDPAETPYAVLFEISDQTPGAWPIAATEQSLTRLADEYIAMGYKARDGDDRELLRTGLRWDAPGDNMVGWYWGADDIDKELNTLITSAFDHAVIHDHMMVRDLCLAAIKELDDDNTFGKDDSRNQRVVGISNVGQDFRSFLDDLATVNPPIVIDRLRAELQASYDVWGEIEDPAGKRGEQPHRSRGRADRWINLSEQKRACAGIQHTPAGRQLKTRTLPGLVSLLGLGLLPLLLFLVATGLLFLDGFDGQAAVEAVHHFFPGLVAVANGLGWVRVCQIVFRVVVVSDDPEGGALGHQKRLNQLVIQLPVEVVVRDVQQNLGGAVGEVRFVAETLSTQVHVRQHRREQHIPSHLLLTDDLVVRIVRRNREVPFSNQAACSNLLDFTFVAEDETNLAAVGLW